MRRVGTGAVIALLLGMAGAAWAEGGHGAAPAHGASAHGAAAPSAGGAKPAPKRMTLPVSPVSLIEGSKSSWSVSDTEAGCYLMSPSRRNSSRVAIGRHPTLGLGLFAVNIALSVPGPEQSERIAVQTVEGELAKDGRMVGAALLFMPLSKAETEVALRTLSDGGPLWLVIRAAWLSHAGLDLAAAIDGFRKQCDRAPTTVASSPGPAPAVPVATVGSKSASAH